MFIDLVTRFAAGDLPYQLVIIGIAWCKTSPAGIFFHEFVTLRIHLKWKCCFSRRIFYYLSPANKVGREGTSLSPNPEHQPWGPTSLLLFWTSDLRTWHPPPTLDLGTYLPTPTSQLGTYSNLLTLGPPPYWHLVVATETRTVGKRTGRILLECSLVWKWFSPEMKWAYSCKVKLFSQSRESYHIADHIQ